MAKLKIFSKRIYINQELSPEERNAQNLGLKSRNKPNERDTARQDTKIADGKVLQREPGEKECSEFFIDTLF